MWFSFNYIHGEGEGLGVGVCDLLDNGAHGSLWWLS